MDRVRSSKGLLKSQAIRLILLASVCAGPAAARVRTVGDTAGLMSALQASGPGDTISLKPGDYAPFIDRFHGTVTITSAEPAAPAIFKSLMVRASSGMSFVGLTFSTEGTVADPRGPGGATPFKIAGSSNINLEQLDVHGSPQGTLETDVSGLSIRSSDHVTVADSNFHNLHFALLHLDDQFLTIRNNEFHDLRDDGIRGGGSSNVLIEGNHCHDNHQDGDRDQDHPDCIQFWTSNTVTGAHDIVVSGNRYERGRGHATQFIFVGNEKHLQYEHLVIKDNVALGSLWNAVRVVFAHDVTITGNHLTSLCAKEQGQTNVAWIATREVDGLVLRDNVAGGYLKLGGDSNVTASHNETRPCQR